MARELGCEQPPPGWVNRLARAGDSMSEAVSAAASHPLTVQLVNSPISCSVCTAWARAREDGIVHGGGAVASDLARGTVRTLGRWCAPDSDSSVRGRGVSTRSSVSGESGG